MSTGGMIRQHPARGLWEGRYVGADGQPLPLGQECLFPVEACVKAP